MNSYQRLHLGFIGLLKQTKTALIAVLMMVVGISDLTAIERVERILWDEVPASMNYDVGVSEMIRSLRNEWARKAFPMGNGRIGCTVFGRPDLERIQFNEDSLWVGNEDNTGGYQPFGDLFVELPHAAFTNYRRELDINRSVHTITYESGGVNYRREYFASYPAQVMVFRFTADKPGSLGGKVSMSNLHEIPITTESNDLVMKGDTSKFWWWQQMSKSQVTLNKKRKYASKENINLDFEARVKVVHEGGEVKTVGNTVVFEKCDSLTLILSADTNYLNQRAKGWKTEHPHQRVLAWIQAAAKKPFGELLAEHIKDYQKLYSRLELDLGRTPEAITKLSTEKRAKLYGEKLKLGEKTEDRDLEVLLYQYARYLIISSSRPGHGGLPANLQGLWLVDKLPIWLCDYHTDINLQMNYWFTGPANVNECFIPVAEWVDSIREVRKEETKKVLGINRGWLMRSENGIFGGSTYHFQKGDSAWVCQNLWDYYCFTQDKEYLARYAYPVMKEISEFWMDNLKELPDGTLVSPNGKSPEHGPFADGVTYDQMLCWDLFSNVIEASKVLGVDMDYTAQVKAKRDKLLGPKIGSWGQLMEWMTELKGVQSSDGELDTPADKHRHLSHMIGLYPGRQIHPRIDPKLAEAAKVSLIARGDGIYGWSLAWRIGLYARLFEASEAYRFLTRLLERGYDHRMGSNLWMEVKVFQIDASFGYAAGVNEMLLQSHLGEIHLLPALPEAWKTGSTRGLRARGGYEIDMKWENGIVTSVTLQKVAGGDGKIILRYGDKTTEVELKAGEKRAVLL